jgi:hypothetical protein
VSFLFSLLSVGFSGSRSPSCGSALAISDLLSLVRPRCRVSVGCAEGVDRLVREFFASSPSLLVFSVASGRFGEGRSAFARRSVACVRSVRAGSRGLLVVLPSSPVCPTGVVPSRRFFGGGSGSWGSAALALGCGRRVLLWLPSGSVPPAWSGVAWSPSVPAPAGCWWLGVAVPAPVAPAQLCLF